VTSFFTSTDMLCRNIQGIYEEQNALCETLQQLDAAEDTITDEERKELEEIRRNAKIAGVSAGCLMAGGLAGIWYLIFRDKVNPIVFSLPSEEQVAAYQVESITGWSVTTTVLAPIVGGVTYAAYHAQKELGMRTTRDFPRSDRMMGKVVSITNRMRHVTPDTSEYGQLEVARAFFKRKVEAFDKIMHVEVS
jgi:hypothetical protein